MFRARFWCRGAILISLFVPATAWSQEAPSLDRLQEAIQTLKDTTDREKSSERGFTARLTLARRLLVDNRAQSLGLVVGLLDENDTQMRLNGAITLAGFARAGDTSPELIEALKRCLRDTNPAITYWGLQGLAAQNMPEKEKLDAIVRCMSDKRSKDIHTAAVYAAKRGNVKQAIPWIVEYQKRRLPSYKLQVEAALIPKKAVAEMRYERTAEPGEEAPEVGKIDPEKLSSQEAVNSLIKRLQAIPVVQELHEVGLILEDMVRSKPQESLFGFDAAPPWALDLCVERAIVWLEKHRGEFPSMPAPAKGNAEEEPKPAKPVEGQKEEKPAEQPAKTPEA